MKTHLNLLKVVNFRNKIIHNFVDTIVKRYLLGDERINEIIEAAKKGLESLLKALKNSFLS